MHLFFGLFLFFFSVADARVGGNPSRILSISELVPLAASCCFFCLLASTLYTVLNILRDGSVGNLSIIPFLCLYVNSILWASYGLLRGLKPVYIPNSIAIPVSIFCLYVYQKYSPKSVINYLTLAFFSSILTCILYNSQMVEELGTLSCVLSIALSASPLSVVRVVIKEKSTASLPFFTSLFIWVASALWTVYGLFIVQDYIIIVPNAISVVLSSVQLFLFTIYGFHTSSKSDL